MGDNVMVGGFIIQGTEPKTVIMRAIGPSLTSFSKALPTFRLGPLLAA